MMILPLLGVFWTKKCQRGGKPVNPFHIQFVIAISITSVGMLLLLLVKKGLKKHITARWQCHLNLLFFVLLAVPFIPSSLFSYINSSLNIRSRLNTLSFERGAETNATANPSGGLTYGIDWLQDFAVPVYTTASAYLVNIILGVWVIGIIFFIIIILICSKNLYLLKESMKAIEDNELLSLFSQCKAEIGVKHNVLIGSSILIKTPLTLCFFKTRIILPAEMSPINDARYAMLHELAHCKNKDVQINSLMCLFQILYWFNPLVYLVFKQMRIDRELACDAFVLEMLPKELHIEYGGTLLNFANKISQASVFTLTAGMGGSKPQIIKRIRHIASFTADTAAIKAKSAFIFILALFFIFSQISLISALAYNNDDMFHGFNFRAENVLYKDMTSFFYDLEGSFVLYDLNNSMYTVHNRDMSITRVSPNSTYKIISALIALETGKLETDNTLLRWDGTQHPFNAWNQDHNLFSAMHYSVSWYFQNFDKQAGIEKLLYYLSQLSYGNLNLSGGVTDFWIESSLGISPLEQLEFLRNFYQNNTIFDLKHVNTLKEVLKLSESENAVLSGKTGTGIVNGKVTNGWFIGYVETAEGPLPSGNTYFFATYIKGEDNAGGSTAAQITLSILKDKGIF